MKVVISKTVSRTYALWNYENYKPSFTITEEIEINSIDTVVLNKLYKERVANLSKLLDEELAKEKEKLKAPDPK